MIEEYKFGEIIIDGKKYDHDVEVRWIPHTNKLGTEQSLEVLKWWRKESHIVGLEDIKQALKLNPEVIIIGTGAYGIAEVQNDVKEYLKEKGICLIIDHTDEAVKTFNIFLKKREDQKKKIIGFFHLTC